MSECSLLVANAFKIFLDESLGNAKESSTPSLSPVTSSQRKNERISSRRSSPGLLADSTWVPIAMVHFFAMTAVLLAGRMAARANS
jgi:hypothetical protein